MGAKAILDVGKTNTKLSLWTGEGEPIARAERENERIAVEGRAALDVSGIEAWLARTLSELASSHAIDAIMPVAHGAGMVAIRGNALAFPPSDYEDPIPEDILAAYRPLRDPFADTGSPNLPLGLNLGAQLFRLECERPGILDGATLLPFAQYWSWRLSGVAASEVTSLGCHSDLWRPLARRFSSLAIERSWAARMAPLRLASDVLGPIAAEWVERTGLQPTVHVHCGIHDSNAALLAARAHPEIGERESTVLSTGTWFVAMRTLGPGTSFDQKSLDETRDCLVNVDAFGRPIPSARFMGGREIETLLGRDTLNADFGGEDPALYAALARVVASRTMALPGYSAGSGPFGTAQGGWIGATADPLERFAAVMLYAALVTDVSLDLIGARQRLLVEGRFSRIPLFVRALAGLRSDMTVYASSLQNQLSFGALRLIDPSLRPTAPLQAVAPLALDLAAYRSDWRREAARQGA